MVEKKLNVVSVIIDLFCCRNWGVTQRRVQEYCKQNVGKDKGITQDRKGSPYHIPEDYPNPFM